MESKTRRLSPSDLQKDTDTLDAIEGINNYAPSKPELSLDSLRTLEQKMKDAKKTEVQKLGEAKAARDNVVTAEHAFHDAILAAKDQVRAHFGADSNEYQSIGMKKKSEKKSPKRKTE
jgi:hypothetical protein